MFDIPENAFPLTYEGKVVGSGWFVTNETDTGIYTAMDFQLNDGVVLPPGVMDSVSFNFEDDTLEASGETQEFYTAEDIRDVHTPHNETEDVFFPPYDN